LTLEHATVIRLAVDGLDAEFVTSLDQALAAAAVTLNPKELRDVAAALLEEFAPAKQQADRDRKTRHGHKAHLSDTPDGGRLDADLDAEGTAILRAALDKFMPKPEPGVLFSHRRAQALIEMARQSLDFGTGHEGAANKPHLVVTISEEQLRNQLGVGHLPDGNTLPASTLRRLACDAKIIPLMYDADSLPTDVGRTTRVVTPAQHIALNYRDGGCKAPGCDRPPAFCDAHHVLSWLDGGITALINFILLCRRHHHRPPRQTPHRRPRKPKIPLHQHELSDLADGCYADGERGFPCTARRHHVSGYTLDGVERDNTVADVFTLENGLVTHMQAYADPDEGISA
jgi:hypothetical protein